MVTVIISLIIGIEEVITIVWEYERLWIATGEVLQAGYILEIQRETLS